MKIRVPHVARAAWLAAAVPVLAAVSVPAARADVRLPRIFGSHMVLQRERPVPVWGWAGPGEKVTVEFAGQRKEATAGPDCRWKISLEPMAARGQGEVLRISGSGTNITEFKDVVVGEVWVCSGQSNMQMPLKDTGATGDIANADLPGVRFISVKPVIASSPKQDVKASPWACSAKTPAGWTAVGFYFGRRLNSELGLPVGLIQATWGGSGIEPWTPLEDFDAIPELAEYIAAFRKKEQAYRQALPDTMNALETWINDARKSIANDSDLPAEPEWPVYPGAMDVEQPAAMYHAMVHPLIPYAIRGVIWYQGEHNGGPGELYYHMMRALIGGWRRAWGQGDFPFYYVQLANYRADTKNPAGGDMWTDLRNCQLRALSITNTGMAVAIDIGETQDIHPKNKYDVGDRLVRWALARDYGQTNIVVSGPLYREMKIEGSRVRLFFDHIGGGLMAGEKTGREPTREVKDGKLQRFAIAGEDRQWVWADAAIDGDTVVVSSPAVTSPVAVRYAYSMNPQGCNLYNRAGLPASPFRTDSWPRK